MLKRSERNETKESYLAKVERKWGERFYPGRRPASFNIV